MIRSSIAEYSVIPFKQLIIITVASIASHLLSCFPVLSVDLTDLQKNMERYRSPLALLYIAMQA